MSLSTTQNLGPGDVNLSISKALNGSAGAVTSDVIDLQNVAPNDSSVRLGAIACIVPAILLSELPNTATITIKMQAAPPSLTTSSAAPALPLVGTFVDPNPTQTLTITGVTAVSPYPGATFYFTIPFDANGSAYQFIRFVLTNGSGVSAAETVTFKWVPL